MQQPIKRLGERLVEGGLVTPAQLQSAITHQKIARGRIGSNLVALGYITEEILMDFLSQQTGVPQIDVRDIEVRPQILKLVPQRLADQFTVLPINTKEPKTLVLAMSDPSDLNAVDSVRFASGLNVEPLVASHSAMRKAISHLYRQLEAAPSTQTTVEVGNQNGPDNGLPVTFSMEPLPLPIPTSASPAEFPPDPFFDEAPPTAQAPARAIDPFSPLQGAPQVPPSQPSISPGLVQGRTIGGTVRRLEGYHTRTLVLGLIRLFQRRGIIGQDELQHLIANLLEAGEIKDDDRVD